MARLPRLVFPWRSLAAAALAANVILAVAQPAIAAPTIGEEIAVSSRLYFQGKGLTARKALAALLDRPEAKDPAVRLQILENLLDICIHGYANACVVQYAPKYLETFHQVPTANEVQKREAARKAAYYFDYGRFAYGAPEVTRQILSWEPWKHENAFNTDLYLRRQLLALRIQLTLDDNAGVSRTVDKILSLVASLKTPQDDQLVVAWALSDVISALTSIGETERAFGIYKASGAFVLTVLPQTSVDSISFRLTAADLLQERGLLAESLRATDDALAAARRIELDEDVREALLADLLPLKATLCLAMATNDCARAAIADHPYAALYAKPGRRAGSYFEVSYLAARALVEAFDRQADPTVVAALAPPLGFETLGSLNDRAEIYRAAGSALAAGPSPERERELLEAGRRITSAAGRRPAAGFGAWYQPGAIDQILIGLALSQAAAQAPGADETIFELLQIAGRRGATFDTDALTALGQARDQMQRRSIHQALRLRARRDRLEREELQKVASRAIQAPQGAPLTYDFDKRRVFRDFAARIADANADLARSGVSTAGANVIPLRAFQAALAPGEAALAVVNAAGGMAYMCVRRDATLRKVVPVDDKQMQLDIRILQAALTAGYAPNEALDSQFPVAAATRLYDVLIRPFDGCLKRGDHILWLPNASITGVPLAALLEHAPPKLGRGYDLAGAAWLVADHSISYAGSASAVVAARSGGGAAAADFDFLGVGDPVLDGVTASGEDRSKIVTRGVRGAASLATLAALPETKIELEASAKGFSRAKILTGAAATEAGVRGQLIGAYRYLSFATHGLLRDDLQGLSEPALALTPVSSADATNDGLLTASEIADLNLAARFVALSACNTANFDLSQMSQDLPALASAFAVAGVPATLGTLWAVDSTTGEAVVSQLFANLRGGEEPAGALARAQRAFLAAPPGRAYLHPRFWAPFVVLGDGGAAARPAGEPGTMSAEVLTTDGDGGEVLAVRRAKDRVLARFIGDGGEAAVRATRRDGREVWRREDSDAAARVLVDLGRTVIVGAQAQGPQGRVVPMLQAYDLASGRPRGTWRGDERADRNAFVAAGARLDEDRAVVAVADLKADGVELHVLAVDAKLRPETLFDIVPPAASIDEVTLTPLSDRLLVTYTQRYPPPDQPALLSEDDFDQPLCRRAPITWVELRDARSGAVLRSKRLDGWMAAGGLARDGGVLLAGGVQSDCTRELKAAVLKLGPDLTATPLWVDASLGASEARSLAALPDGGIFVAARKANVLDYATTPGRGYDANDLSTQYGGMLVNLAADGAARKTKMLDSGGNLFVFAADASDPDDILVGGSLGEDAAIFHLSGR